MSSQLLFECLSEEIPSRMQNSSAAQVKSYITNAFSKNNVKFVSIEVYVTARRIALFIDGVSALELKDFNNEIKGPRVNAPKSAIEGFLRKNRKGEEDLLIRKVNDEDFTSLREKAAYLTSTGSSKINWRKC